MAAPADDKRNAAVSHVNTNYQAHNGKWYDKVTPGRPATYPEAVDLVQAAMLLGLPPASSQAAILAELAKRAVAAEQPATPATP